MKKLIDEIQNEELKTILKTGSYDEKQRTFTTKINPIQIHALLHIYKILDCDATYQRDFVANIKWKVQFIESLLKHLPTPSTIYLWIHPTNGKVYIIDGQQRCKTIEEWMNDGFKVLNADGTYINKVKVKKSFYSELNNHNDVDYILDNFRNYNFNVVVFDKTHTSKDIARHFRNLNNMTSLVHMEILNCIMGYGCTQLRNLSRIHLNGVENKKVHTFFKEISMDLTRMKGQEFISKCFLYEQEFQKRTDDGINTLVSMNEVDELYNSLSFMNDDDDPDIKKNLDKKIDGVKRRLNFITSWIKTEKETVNSKQFIKSPADLMMFYKLTYWLDKWLGYDSKCKIYKITDLEKFVNTLWTVIGDLKDNSELIKELKAIDPNANTNSVKTRYVTILANHTKSDLEEQEKLIIGKLKEYCNGKDMSKLGIILRDRKRHFDRDDKAQGLRKNNICPVSDKIMNIDNCHADHIKPWSKGILEGGVTTVDNMMLLHKEVNAMKGDREMTIEEMRAEWREKNKKVA